MTCKKRLSNVPLTLLIFDIWLNMFGITYECLFCETHQSRLQQSNSASAVLHSWLMVFSSFETAAWLLQGSFRAGDHSTLSNLSVHTSIELVLNLFLSVLCSGRFVLFNSKFILRRDPTALSPTETLILWFLCASGHRGRVIFQQKSTTFADI